MLNATAGKIQNVASIVISVVRVGEREDRKVSRRGRSFDDAREDPGGIESTAGPAPQHTSLIPRLSPSP